MATYEKAYAIWQAMLKDENLFGAGRRNDDAVNICCVCMVLGKDPVSGYSEQYNYHYNNDVSRSKIKVDIDFDAGRTHLKRVLGYCNSWFDESNEDIIEDYGILSASYMQVEE